MKNLGLKKDIRFQKICHLQKICHQSPHHSNKMKAKEYAEKYKANPTPQCLGRIAVEMLVEVKGIAESRHAKSDDALISILNEVINKWRAFAKIVGDESISTDGLKQLIVKDFPFIPKHLLT